MAVTRRKAVKRKGKRQTSAENSGIMRGGPPETLFKAGNPYRFQPGQSGNPGGRPKLLSEAYQRKLAEVSPNDPEGRTYAEIIAAGQVVKAISDTASAREIRSATEGNRLEVDGLNNSIELVSLTALIDLGEEELNKMLENLAVALDSRGTRF